MTRRHRVFLILMSWLLATLAGATADNANKATSEAIVSVESESRTNDSSAIESRAVEGRREGEKESREVLFEEHRYSPSEDDGGEQTDEDEYEGGEDDGDEYADELHAVAESHEAMSRRDENRNGTSTNGERVQVEKNTEERLGEAKKDFDSREKSVESGSDESESSNETVVKGEQSDDEEVAELLKYKSANHFREGESNGGEVNSDENDDAIRKRKRVPTVKKELSTQKEIKPGNESRVEKRFSTKEVLDEFNRQLEVSSVSPESLTDSKSSSTETESFDEVEDDREPEVDDYYEEDSEESRTVMSDSKMGEDRGEDVEGSRKLYKRQEAVLRDLEAYLRAEYAAEQEQQQKLEELGAKEGVLAESLLELLVKLAENPRRWERVHRLLMDVEGGLELSRQALEAKKRSFDPTSRVTSTTTSLPVATTSRKPQNKSKKKKKKKKKQRHHRFTTTTTTIPNTIPLLTTTEAPWLTTPMQWRLVAERLFGPPWPQEIQDDANVAKVRYGIASKARSSPFDQHVETKERNDHKVLNDEREALMLESSREYTQPRHVHYGKVSTHQGIGSHRETPSENYGSSNRDVSRVRDYDPPERMDYSRYGQYVSSLEYNRGRLLPVSGFAQNHEYRPPGREYAASKDWQDSQYKYGGANWKSDERSSPESKWTWRQQQTGAKTNPWPQPGDRDPWHWDREYWPENKEKSWTPLSNDPEGLESWDRGTGSVLWPKMSERDSWDENGKSRSAYVRESNEHPSPPWKTTLMSHHAQTPGTIRGAGKKQKNHVDPNSPKMTMKTWNSLTSDPATWPLRLSDVKPWPKDENGKSYNPNADLVRKLGLDQPETSVVETDLPKEFNAPLKTSNVSKYKNNAPRVESGSVTWPLTQSTKSNGWNKSGKTYNPPESLVKGLPLGGHMDVESAPSNSWTTAMDTNPKVWPPKAVISPKIQSVGAWVMPADQSTWKPYNLKNVDSFQHEDTEHQRWNVQMDAGPRAWNKYPKPSNEASWPKWKQFAYHRVTAMPILNSGAAMDGTRSRNNAYIAVSAVSPKYNANQWRKNDIEETPVSRSGSSPVDTENPTSQLRAAGIEPPIYTWKKNDLAPNLQTNARNNSTDPLEEQLETLKRDYVWSHNEVRDNIKKQLNVINNASKTLASRFSSTNPSNSSYKLESPASVTNKGTGDVISPEAKTKRDKGTADNS